MNSTFGNKFQISLFGESHGKAVGGVITGIPAGTILDMDFIQFELDRRKPGGPLATTRKEEDIPVILSGTNNGVATGAPLAFHFENNNQNSSSYDNLKDTPRPSHADYVANIKYGGNMDMTGGGPFSARFTAGLVFCGAVAKIILESKGIYVNANLYAVGTENEPKNFENAIDTARKNLDSIGGTVLCCVEGMPVGVGNPHFEGLENKIAQAVFAIPGVKQLTFGTEYDIRLGYGSEYNDEFYYDGETVKTKTNHSGGINGGISNGMPIEFLVGFRPTPSIAKQQDTINLKTKENVKIEITGRHDPCIAFRGVPVVESATAVAILDLML